MYNKLFTKILDSSIWLAPDPHRLVWITILAAMNEDGIAQFASVANLAHRARVDIDQAKSAVLAFEGVDLDSGDPDNDGRRIERIPGGWLVLNAHKYREMVTKVIARERTRERVAKFRAKQSNANVTASNVSVTPSEAESISRSEAVSKKKPMSAPQTVVDVFEHWKVTHKHPMAKLDAKRKKAIAEALKCYAVPDLCLAITGYLNSPHHMGQNDKGTVYDDIELMLRDAKHIDAGLRFGRDPPRTDLSSLTRKNVAATNDWVPPEMRNATV